MLEQGSSTRTDSAARLPATPQRREQAGEALRALGTEHPQDKWAIRVA